MSEELVFEEAELYILKTNLNESKEFPYAADSPHSTCGRTCPNW